MPLCHRDRPVHVVYLNNGIPFVVLMKMVGHHSCGKSLHDEALMR